MGLPPGDPAASCSAVHAGLDRFPNVNRGPVQSREPKGWDESKDPLTTLSRPEQILIISVQNRFFLELIYN